MVGRRSPCLAHDCHICCLGTRMTLTEADVARLEAAGHRGCFFVNDDHDLQLLNIDGRCVFLADGRCTVYADRPEGCRLYPLILDLSTDRIVLDPVCPWPSEFNFTEDDFVSLRRSVAEEEREARLRRSSTRSG